ncbi:hypothetical protein HPP92_020273 [Vanilla planifolia]|uniref:UBA domain-containing protein n=1 Tax=Vanilla planifolia TaxID=51239 RepID=A0A835Q6X4_VANPL|nr:hypothetical protein HPP92_020273 [Vanilla planifolia]
MHNLNHPTAAAATPNSAAPTSATPPPVAAVAPSLPALNAQPQQQNQPPVPFPLNYPCKPSCPPSLLFPVNNPISYINSTVHLQSNQTNHQIINRSNIKCLRPNLNHRRSTTHRQLKSQTTTNQSNQKTQNPIFLRLNLTVKSPTTTPPSQPPNGPPIPQYYGANPPSLDLLLASRPSSGPNYGGPAILDSYQYGSTSLSAYNMKPPPFSAPQTSVGSVGGGGYQRLPTAKLLPQSSSSGGGGSAGNRVPIDDVVEKVSTMGFSREQVRLETGCRLMMWWKRCQPWASLESR